ncbi:MAG: 1-deoxy-D-xylulose-5-phosphate reductoisomerase [Burkholderiales bacterium]
MTTKNLTILGATGTIGLNTLSVVARHPERYKLFALTANSNYQRLVEQVERYRPVYAVLADETKAAACRLLQTGTCYDTTFLYGTDALERVASDPAVDIVMAAIVGAAGLKPTLAAARAGRRVLLANKEALVMSGNLLMEAVQKNDAELLPIDSEHNAVFQALPQRPGGLAERGVSRIILTASGGPFRTWNLAEIENVTPAQAVKHPNWVMGKKISVDSATMMNKGLEVIEACWLFGAEASQVEIVIHPESIVHSMVSYRDGSVLAQMSNPDMRIPIAYGLAFPERIEAGVATLDLATIGKLNFEALDNKRFPCVELAYRAIDMGGTAATLLNAANEVAVEAFLIGELSFGQIYHAIDFVLKESVVKPVKVLQDVMVADGESRLMAQDWIKSYKRRRSSAAEGVM